MLRTPSWCETAPSRLSTKADRVPLKDAVNMLVAKTEALSYSDAYRLVHQRMNVDSVEDLTIEQLPVAVEYVHGLVVQAVAVQGELLPRDPNDPRDEEYVRRLRINGLYLMERGLQRYTKQSNELNQAWYQAGDILGKLDEVRNLTSELTAALRGIRHNDGVIYDALSEAQCKVSLNIDELREAHQIVEERAL